MRISIIQSMALACALMLTACATPIPEHLALSTAARASIESTEVVAPVRQSEIYVFVPASTSGAQAGAQGGLIGALVGAAIDSSVDASRAKKAETAIKPLRDAMIDYNFDDKLKGDLQKSLGGVGWLKLNGVRVLKDNTPASLGKAITGSKGGAVLMVVGDYKLSENASALTVTLAADLFANNDALRKLKPAKTANADLVYHPGNALYRNTVVQTVDLPEAAGDRDANMKLWAADNAKLVRTSLDAASDSLSRQLAEDIQKEPEVVPAAPAPGAAKTKAGK